jgi:hypothetical protein
MTQKQQIKEEVMKRITVDYWKHVNAGEKVHDGYGHYKTAPSDPGCYTLYELANDNNQHTGWEWVKEERR